MKKEDILQFKTKQEKETAKKIIKHLIMTVKMMEEFPQGDKNWSDGCITGMKQLTWSLIYYLDNPKEQEIFEKLLGWEEMVKKRMGAKRFKIWKEQKDKDIAKHKQ